ncbi:GntR family transcriptional regulator [Mailhella massiliensis]|uniref:GntR family transcriptional regulator n=1 Tax=Mailhella massiliensis TaxID=1903261 RepID=UPI00097E0298
MPGTASEHTVNKKEERLHRLHALYEEADAPCLYQRVADAIEEGIKQGVFRPGDALPTQRALATEIGVTTGTATHGYACHLYTPRSVKETGRRPPGLPRPVRPRLPGHGAARR